MNAYQVIGLTKTLTATTVSAQVTFTPVECLAAFNGQAGPLYIKITNGSSDNNVYFVSGKTAQTAVKPTAGSPGSTPIPAYAEVIVQVNDGPSIATSTINIACVADSSAMVFMTPVLNVITA
jgi:hypothetical protein